MTVIMVLLYILNGVLTLEQKAFKSDEDCYRHAEKRIQETMADPHFEQGLYAACVPSKLQEVQRIGDKFF